MARNSMNSIYGGSYTGAQAGGMETQGLGMVPMVIEQSGRGLIVTKLLNLINISKFPLF